MDSTEKRPGYYLKDRDRCAFSLGWEYRRRGKPLDDNPFPLGHWKHEAFIEGYQQFLEPSQRGA